MVQTPGGPRQASRGQAERKEALFASASAILHGVVTPKIPVAWQLTDFRGKIPIETSTHRKPTHPPFLDDEGRVGKKVWKGGVIIPWQQKNIKWPYAILYSIFFL